MKAFGGLLDVLACFQGLQNPEFKTAFCWSLHQDMTSTSGYKPADSKREEFRKYLEKAGVLDALTKVLVALYEEPEKPGNALDFLRQHIHMGPPDTADVESLKLQVAELTQKNEELKEEVTQLRQRLEQYEPKSEEKEGEQS